ncbi:TonB-dependent receptor [Stagnimonas aquatica]|uniref:TonB-dependent receptor n=1 Tax=Stagnimonas aquatica TaxID=2689987 RepID=A0A3N0VIN2_9GAMM|nr:TonB-dependent receptor [Stagnimonas aquatica]ROH92078.1 TonB-dependent receptor [Stagnimonas aquatica]
MKRERIAGAVLLLAATAAPAQETVGTLPVQSLPEAGQATPGEQPQVVELERVTVTGELLKRDISRTTSSVAVHTGAEIERGTAEDVYDLIRATPNASLDDSDYGVGGMTLRGIGSYGASGSGAYAAYGTASAVVLDGVGLPRSALSYADLSAFDLDSVEILRGPQSTSQGRNAMAGAVILNTRVPEPEESFSPELRGRISAGSAQARQYAGALGATLWPEALAARLVYDHRQDDGDSFNATRDERDWARQRSDSLRLRLNWRPGGDGGRYQAMAGVSELRRSQGSSYVPMSEEHSRTALSDAPQDYRNRAWLYSLEQRLSLSETWRLRAISAYVESDTHSRFDGDYTAEAQNATEQQENARAYSQELRADYAGERVQASFGAYYYRDRNRDDQSGFINVNALLEIAGACGLQLVCAAPLGNILFEATSPTRVEDMAVFGELDWALTPGLTLTAGARLDQERNRRVITSNYRGDSPTASLAVALLGGAGVLPNDVNIPVSRQFSEFLPKLAARYELIDDWYLGAAYAEGYRPGGDGYNQVSGRHFRFESERTRNYELSLKGRHRPWKLEAALNLFRTRWEDLQIQQGSGTDNYMGNAGPAQIRGGELELRWRPLRPLRLIGGVGLTHGRFGEGVQTSDNVDLSGHRLPKAPAYSATLALEWMPLPGLLIRPDMQWSGRAAGDSENTAAYELPAYQLINLALRWQRGPVGLFLAGSNLADTHYRKDANGYSFSKVDVVSLGAGRRLSAGLDFQFR